ncbi:DUF4189 domain-containing protein [Shimia sp. R11_0]|uniref:DUF4189 domain-containing protein n=1 Tax=Shimia sp. R11_0 TaxID=2821096 RepID=UPI001ADCD5CF|nr:DUF4189 domain-containing protein [Shimia sp. R11_0]MBO9476308.1 DUF4189 domain-containing protein [Shimia sp. R11_0]
MKTRILTLAMIMGLTGQVAAAGQCGFAYCWGAVAIGQGGVWGWAHSHYSEQSAINALQNECGGNCDNLHTFYNSCGAIAEGSSGNWGFGEGATRAHAEYTAKAYCATYGGGCEIRAWACSP